MELFVTSDPKTYQMLVHIFGAKSSPSVAGYALRRTAKDNEHYFSSAAIDEVFRDFYVDDLLKSFADSEQAKVTSKELQKLLAKQVFNSPNGFRTRATSYRIYGTASYSRRSRENNE